jgi:hypothetical protein
MKKSLILSLVALSAMTYAEDATKKQNKYTPPEVNRRKCTYETKELSLCKAPESFDGRVAKLEYITSTNALGDASAKTIKFSTWKNERANAQIVLWTKDPVNQVRFKASELKSANSSIKSCAVQTRFVRYTTAAYLHPSAKGPARFVGDILDDATSLNMNTNTFRPVWVSVKVPENAAAGNYKGTLEAIAAGGKKITFNLELEVLNRTLPKPADWKFFLDLWQHPWAVARYHSVKPFSKDHYALMKPLWEELANAGQKVITTTITDLPWNHQNFDAYHSMIRHIKNPDGTFTRDYSLWDEYVDFCEKCGLGPQIHCYTMATWGHVVYWEDALTGDIQKGKLVPGTPEHEAFWGPFLSDFRDHLKAKGKLGKVYIALDERSREELYATANLIKKCAPELKLAMAGNKKPSEFAGITMDNYCQYIQYITPEYLKEVYSTRPSDKFTSTFYICCGPSRPNTFTDSPLPESAWIGLYAAATKIDGLLRWAFVNWPIDPITDSSFGHWRPADTFLLYPNCRSSARWEMLRDGIEECEKIRILRAEGKATKVEDALKEINYPKAAKASNETIANDVDNVFKAVFEASK